VPYLSGRVNDLAELISPETEARISSRLEDFDSRTGSQIAVLTLPSLEGEVLEDFSLRVAETWGLGRAEHDDGVLLLIARDDRKMRIEVGYGLEAELTDVESGRILDHMVRPRFRAGDFDGGIELGVDAIVGSLEGKEVIPPDPPHATEAVPLSMRLFMGGMFTLVVGLFSMIAIFSPGCQGWFLYAFLVPFWGTFPMVILGVRGGLIALGLWVVGAPILKIVLSYTSVGRSWREKHPWGKAWTAGSGSSSSGGSFSSSGGSFSSGGFSGGGGSFGGGGASSSW
jgi:uncharacterized protein